MEHPDFTPEKLKSLATAPELKRKRYWAGCLPRVDGARAPFYSVVAGGITFHLSTTRDVVNGDDVAMEYRIGQLVELTDPQLKNILHDIASKVVRYSWGDKSAPTCEIHDTRSKVYSPQAADKPLAHYLYLIERETRGLETDQVSLFDAAKNKKSAPANTSDPSRKSAASEQSPESAVLSNRA